jgi:hypothetical protein
MPDFGSEKLGPFRIFDWGYETRPYHKWYASKTSIWRVIFGFRGPKMSPRGSVLKLGRSREFLVPAGRGLWGLPPLQSATPTLEIRGRNEFRKMGGKNPTFESKTADGGPGFVTKALGPCALVAMALSLLTVAKNPPQKRFFVGGFGQFVTSAIVTNSKNDHFS